MKGYKLILVGGLKKEDESYFESLKKLADNNQSIIFKPNASYQELIHLYKSSEFYLHTAGFGIDEQKEPQLVEHLGIAPLEAMASGCITFCYNAGGAKEFIVQGKNGFLYNNKEEFISKITSIKNASQNDYLNIRIHAKKTVEDMFSFKTFKRNVMKLFSLS
jgi:glycosyltransferase involved in cell wall biosynthesis